MKTEKPQGAEKLSSEAVAFSQALANWFKGAARDLPWRSEPSVYRTVVSEFMLQQTQVKTVLPYFERWMRTLPDFKALAEADEAKLLKQWEGLGYYNRVRNLQKLARRWMKADPKPTAASEWIDYPGIGQYTAAAIASIAFDESVAVVDGNVVRILARLSADDTEFADNSKTVKHFSALAQSLIGPSSDPGKHNEAMMELGATLCRKANPQCLLCPVRIFCSGYKRGIAETLPRLAKRKIINRSIQRLWVIEADCPLLHRRPNDAKRLAGLFELPELMNNNYKIILKGPMFIGSRGIANERIKEVISEAIIECSDRAKLSKDDAYHWIPLKDLNTISITGPHKKWIKKIIEETYAH